MEAISGPDPNDPTSSKKTLVKYRKGLKREVKIRIGIPKELLELDVSVGIKRVSTKSLNFDRVGCNSRRNKYEDIAVCHGRLLYNHSRRVFLQYG